MLRKILRNMVAILMFLVVWKLSPIAWLHGLGVDYGWIGLLKIAAAIFAAWLIAVWGRTRPMALDAEKTPTSHHTHS